VGMSDDKKYKYHTVNLPENLALKIEEVIDSGKHGYTSVPDFVKSAVRRYLRELGYLS
jgi:Arc/MetJ-type ribon-helix-helix transcriptional regulator